MAWISKTTCGSPRVILVFLDVPLGECVRRYRPWPRDQFCWSRGRSGLIPSASETESDVRFFELGVLHQAATRGLGLRVETVVTAEGSVGGQRAVAFSICSFANSTKDEMTTATLRIETCVSVSRFGQHRTPLRDNISSTY